MISMLDKNDSNAVLITMVLAVHRVAWPDRGETADDPSWSESFLCRPCFRKCESLLRLKQDDSIKLRTVA